MTAHPMLLVRALQLACAASMLGTLHAPAREPGAVEFSLSLLGERETPDGSWEGADLLAHPGARVERFQLTLRQERNLRVVVEARLPNGTTQQIFPEPGKEGVLARGQTYALPAPHAFYALEGNALLVLTASPVHASALVPALVRPGALEADSLLPLSDGARARVQSARVANRGPLRLEFKLGGR